VITNNEQQKINTKASEKKVKIEKENFFTLKKFGVNKYL